MGTNYYLKKNPGPVCPHCGHRAMGEEEQTLHIGKSSVGWAFALHVMPERGVDDLDDWRKLWSLPDVIIVDEYGMELSVGEMERVITQRMPMTPGYVLQRASGENLHHWGAGTWDCITGEFS